MLNDLKSHTPSNIKTAGIAGILFDKDGTLLDYDKSWAPVNRALAMIAAEDDQAFADRLLLAVGMHPVSGHVVPDSLLAAGNTVEIAQGLVEAGSRLSIAELTEKLDALFSNAAGLSVPVTDLAVFFARLKGRGLKLGIASSDNERSIRAIAARFGFAHHLDFVAGYDSGHGSKPEPGMVFEFCAQTGIQPEQVAVVGDNNHDLHMARNARAGLAIAVLTGTGSRESLAPASDFLLDDITGLDEVLDNLG